MRRFIVFSGKGFRSFQQAAYPLIYRLDGNDYGHCQADEKPQNGSTLLGFIIEILIVHIVLACLRRLRGADINFL